MGGIVRGYENLFLEHIAAGEFSIDSEGRIWKHVDHRKGFGVLDPPRRAERGKPGQYQQIAFYHDGRRLMGTAHRLVYRALKGPIPEGMEINHDDGIKDRNHPDNLLPETPSGNMKHAYSTGLKDEHGEVNPAAKLTDEQVCEIRELYAAGGTTMMALGQMFSVNFRHISRIIRGQRRNKQQGPISDFDLRHSVCPRDQMGRFIAP